MPFSNDLILLTLAELLVTVKQDRQFLCNRSVIVSDDMTGTVCLFLTI
jgi:hypothetical protein